MSCSIAALGHDAVLPRVLAPADTAGVTAELPGIPAGLPVAAGAGDNAGAALGLGAHAGDVDRLDRHQRHRLRRHRRTRRPTTTGTVAGFADA